MSCRNLVFNLKVYRYHTSWYSICDDETIFGRQYEQIPELLCLVVWFFFSALIKVHFVENKN